MDWFKITFSIDKGYLFCKLTNNKIRRKFYLHRLIYLFYNPDFDIFNKKIYIDHLDRDKSNNSIENLRSGTPQENSFNTDAKGYAFHKKSGKWIAKICVSYKDIHLGLHNTKEEAQKPI
jgi:hypothetical protein